MSVAALTGPQPLPGSGVISGLDGSAELVVLVFEVSMDLYEVERLVIYRRERERERYQPGW